MEYKVSPEQFTILDKMTIETAYILGLIWADGSISKNGKGYRISIEGKKQDLDTIKNVFMKTGLWGSYVRPIRERQKSEMLNLYTSNKDIWNFLHLNNYDPNNKLSANNILQNIPKNLHKYWFRGLICGDGSFYLNSKTKRKNFTLAGPYNQNWDFIISLFEELNINKFSIITKKNLKGSYSNIVIQNYDGILKLGNYIYDDFNINKIGLERKYNKFLEIKNICKFDEFGNINTNNKLTNTQILEIRKLYSPEKCPSRMLGKMFNVDKSIILDIINGRIHKEII